MFSRAWHTPHTRLAPVTLFPASGPARLAHNTHQFSRFMLRFEFSLVSLRSSRFRFLQAKRGKRARALGKKEQKQWERGGGAGYPFPSPPLPPATTFFAPFFPMPLRACPAWLEGNGNDCYAGYYWLAR